ncbi:carbon storage regulator CsrA [Paenibacillus sp. sptzw28]|uniref:carbon storage regulator CsrA n=1 Tax=Paenibacillus sp. sptzw28 TaxID=715179 RepID=UPI001C6F473E|nr:carbon storage regulator CsrA [Paenibacillus sp. sptzw28]QYR22112.1 carbon storage regulator CsrA [Paenibacillus sp. sptzw28]
MLILTRKKGQSIIINNNIEILISAVDGDQIKIGIRAPEEISIFRKEVYEEVQQTNQEAVASKLSLNQIKNIPEKK